MKPVEVSLEQVLLARENRAGRQQRLLAQYGLPLVSFTMNMAGPVKDTPLSRFAFQAGVAALTKRLGGPVSCCLTEAVTGCEALLVYDRPAQALKDVCMELESTEVGRLYDLDVLDAAGEKLSRPEMRRCLVCGGPVAVCSRSRAHGLDAICTETARRLAEFACTTLGNLAADALREEAALSPKPGLVDSRTNGAHTDMDLLLMLRSAETLRPWFCRMVRLGLDGAAPAQLQNAGRQAEAQMLQATGGVNTHKGALYALSLLLAAMGRHLSGAQESIFSLAAADAAALAPPVGTHGSQVRRRYGRPGAREEAMDGFPSLQQALCSAAPRNRGFVRQIVRKVERDQQIENYPESYSNTYGGNSVSIFYVHKRSGSCGRHRRPMCRQQVRQQTMAASQRTHICRNTFC